MSYLREMKHHNHKGTASFTKMGAAGPFKPTCSCTWIHHCWQLEVDLPLIRGAWVSMLEISRVTQTFRTGSLPRIFPCPKHTQQTNR